jgi:phage tail protein X
MDDSKYRIEIAQIVDMLIRRVYAQDVAEVEELLDPKDGPAYINLNQETDIQA